MGQRTKILGRELPGRVRCRQRPSLWLQPDELDFVSSPRSCGLFFGLPLLPCLSLPRLAPAFLWLLEDGAGTDEASGCGERRCRLIPTAAFPTMVLSGWHIDIIPGRFSDTTTLSSPSDPEIRVISLHGLRNFKKKRFAS